MRISVDVDLDDVLSVMDSDEIAQLARNEGFLVTPKGQGDDARANTIVTAPSEPLVMKIFDPLITYSSPSRRAVVRIPATSEPAPGSVIPRQPIFSPRIPAAR